MDESPRVRGLLVWLAEPDSESNFDNLGVGLPRRDESAQGPVGEPAGLADESRSVFRVLQHSARVEESVGSMVLGIGFDLIDLTDFARTLERSGERFLRRVYTKKEIEYCQTQPHCRQSYAVRFAAKEAAMKALGIAGEEGLCWRDFEVILGASGQPSMTLHGRAAAKARILGVCPLLLALSHSKSAAGAVVIAEGSESRRALRKSSRTKKVSGPRTHGQ